MNDKLNRTPAGAELTDEKLDKVAGGVKPFSRCSECGEENAPHEVTEGVATFRLCESCFQKYQKEHPGSA